MLVLVDECVHRSVALVFVERGHTVTHVVDELAPKTPDHIVAAYADLHEATVVTWNVKHYRRFLNRRNKAGDLIFPKMGLIGFQCPELSGETRLRAHIGVIELEHKCVQGLADKRLRVLISFDQLNIFR